MTNEREFTFDVMVGRARLMRLTVTATTEEAARKRAMEYARHLKLETLKPSCGESRDGLYLIR